MTSFMSCKICVVKFLIIPVITATIFFSGCSKNEKRSAEKATRIVFLSNREAPTRKFDIFTMHPDGSSLTNLTSTQDGITSVSHPVLSPDGMKIVYLAFRQQRKMLMYMTADGSGPQELVEVNVDSPDPVFSPDGSRLLYITKVRDRRQIHIYDFEIRSSHNISNNDANEFEAVFSHNGTEIVFVSDMDTHTKSIWLMKQDGSGRIMLTNPEGENRHPDFSPDDEHIVFSSSRDGDFEIYLMDTEDGGNLFKITDNDIPDIEPRFSPDGSVILYSSNQRGIRSKDLIAFNRETGTIKNITEESRFINQHARFSPNGKQVVFEASDGEVYLVDIDGTNLKNLTNDPHWDCAPEF